MYTATREPCRAIRTAHYGSLPCTQQPSTQPHCVSARTRMALRSEGRHAPPGAHAQACRRGGGIEAGTSSTRSQPDAARPLRRKVRTLPVFPRLKASLPCTLHCSVHVNIAKLLAYLLTHATIQPAAMSHAS